MLKAIIGHICMVFFMAGCLFAMDPAHQENLNGMLVAHVLDPKTPTGVIKSLINSGADPEMDCIVFMEELNNQERVVDLHYYGLDILAYSPEGSWKKQCAGNKDVMDYVFAELLQRKLETIIEVEKEVHGQVPSDGKGIVCVSRYHEEWMEKKNR